MLSYLKGWRTIAVNVVVVAAGVVAYLNDSTLGSLLPPKYAWVPIAIGVANIVMRSVTTTPVGQKS
jgi:uncharacterized membrane protein